MVIFTDLMVMHGDNIFDLADNKARFNGAISDALDMSRNELADVLRCIDNPVRFDASSSEPKNRDAKLIAGILLPVSEQSLGRLLGLLTELRMLGLYYSAWAI